MLIQLMRTGGYQSVFVKNISGFFCASYCGSIDVLLLFSDICVARHWVLGTEPGAFADKEIRASSVR